MKLEVGMYVRLKRNQGIAKIEDYEEYVKRFVLDEVIGDEWGEETCLLDLDDVFKASHNIIDLIEVGDYVNGYKVYHIDYAWNDSTRLVPYVDCIKNNYVNEIKSIVTKEQFEAIKYDL